MALTEVERTLNALLKGGPFNPAEDRWEATANVLLADINIAKANGADDIDIEFMIDELRTVVIAIEHAGTDPFEVPREELIHALNNPLPGTVFIDLDSRQRINGPNRAIRAKCMECQGNNLKAVRDCNTMTCVLWPFRLAGNPFYGRLAAVDENDEIVDSEEFIAEMEAERTTVQSEVEKTDANS